MQRCPWAATPELEAYHDAEWGVPFRDDTRMFEFLVLETFQAGLSWLTILRKREAFRRAFAGFDAERVARFDDRDVERLLEDAGIIRNRAKIRAAIANAQRYLELRRETGSASDWFWSFTDGKPIVNRWTRSDEIPSTTQLAETISRELKRRGFSFVGPTVVYAHLQATGIVNDHLTSCPRHAACAEEAKRLSTRAAPSDPRGP